MRLSLLVVLLVGVALAVGQADERRQRARARFLSLASKARRGDQAAQQELKARRRVRTRQHITVTEDPVPVTQRPVFQVTTQPTPVTQRLTARQRARHQPSRHEPQPRPSPQPKPFVRTREPVRRTRVRLPRPLSPIPTTFRPHVFPHTIVPVPVFSQTDAPIIDHVTQLPVSEVFPTEPITETPVFFENTQAPDPVRLHFNLQPDQPVSIFETSEQPIIAEEPKESAVFEEPEQFAVLDQPEQFTGFEEPEQLAVFEQTEPSPSVFEQPEQPVPVVKRPQRPRLTAKRIQRLKPTVKQIQRTRPTVKQLQQPSPVNERPKQLRPAIRRPQEPQRSTFDLEPHRALNQGLEVSSRAERIKPRVSAEKTTKTPVETIRRYSHFDEQGNYVFGYEAADGSFKEEKRGLDCIVTGKYGYVDPDGIRREFTYTSGNKCDPNAVVDPETQEVKKLPLNDQFLKQTVQQRLTEDELDQLHINRRRQPLEPAQVQRNPQQSFISDRRRQQSRVRPTARQRQQQSNFQVQQRQRQRPQESHQAEEQQRFSPIPVTPAPTPASIFTTPESFNQFTTPHSLHRPQVNLQPQPQQRPVKVQEVTPSPSIAVRPTQPEVLLRPKPSLPSPRPLPASRPQSKPIPFDFNREFQGLFNHFAIPTTRRPFFQDPIPAFHRPTLSPTPRPQPPTPFPRPRPTTPRPPTAAPAFSRSPFDDGSTTLGHKQLVFDATTGSFKTVHTQQPKILAPLPVQNPFVTPAPRLVSNPFATPATHPVTGVPLTLTHGPPSHNPLPSVPTGGLVIHNQGRSLATDEFDRFFEQFNLKF